MINRPNETYDRAVLLIINAAGLVRYKRLPRLVSA
jgi:hypothetical protein